MKTQIFEKKGNISSEKNLLAYFSRIIENDKRQGRTQNGRQSNLTITAEVTSSLL